MRTIWLANSSTLYIFIIWDAFVGCTNLTAIYAEGNSRPDTWMDSDYLEYVYWGNEWEYVNGVPTLK